MSCVVSIYLNCRYNVYSNTVCLFRSSGEFWCFSFLTSLFRFYFMCKSKEIYWAGFSKFKVYTKKINVFREKKWFFVFLGKTSGVFLHLKMWTWRQKSPFFFQFDGNTSIWHAVKDPRMVQFRKTSIKFSPFVK